MTPLVLLSGWGCDARIWQPLVPYWPERLRVTTPNWPGYGTQPPLKNPGNLSDLATAMASQLPAEATWVGWSLGGLLAAALLDHLPAPRVLILLGMGPRFCHAGGVSCEELTAFHRTFTRDPDAALRHFQRWQLSGEPEPCRAHHQLNTLLGDTTPDTATLAAGLEWLAHLDVQGQLEQADCPVWQLAGEHDPLFAPGLHAPALPNSTDQRLADAGHCPMLSQPALLVESLSKLAALPAGVIINAE